MATIGRLHWIDISKSIAILMVVFVHFDQQFSAPLPLLSYISSSGARGPQLFFIISAFLTWMSLSKKNGKIAGGYCGFVKGRLKRILPEYYLALLFAIISFIAGLGYPKELTWEGYLSHILLVNGFSPKHINSILIVEWYVSNLIIFYFLAPYIIKIVGNLKQSLIFLPICILFSIGFHYLTSEITAYKDYFSTLCIIVQLPVIAIGIVLYYLCSGNAIKSISTKVYLSVSLAFACSLACFFLLDKWFGCISKSLFAGLVFGWFLYTLSFTERKGVKLHLWLSTILSKYSLGIYLFHMFLIKILGSISYFSAFTKSLLGWLLVLVFVITISTIISFFTNRISNKIVLFQ